MEGKQLSRQDKLEAIVKLFSKSMYGSWEWETPNERTIEMLMREVGYWPYQDEDEMIVKTQVDEDLYQRARKEIPIRSNENKDHDTKEESEPRSLKALK